MTIVKENRTCIIDTIRKMEDFSKASPHLILRPLSVSRALDRQAIFQSVGDIALVLYLIIDESDNELASMIVTQHHVEKWKQAKETLFEMAMSNTFRRDPPRIYNLEGIMQGEGIKGKPFLDDGDKTVLSGGITGDCLSTVCRLNGAIAVFYPGVAGRIAELLDDDFFMAFTSIHEVMIHPCGTVSPDDIKCVLQDTIHDATAEQEFLSYGIFRYYRSKNMIRKIL